MTQADLRHGCWQDVLTDVECDALIVDAPYSERTHSGHNTGSADSMEARAAISYSSWADADVEAFVQHWAPRTRGWFVSITDATLAPAWTEALRSQGRYVFAPLPFVETGSRVRLQGDGPSSWTCWVMVSRPSTRAYAKWGTLPGAYIGTSERKPVMGGKPLGLMRALVRDYSRPGDLICDPCAGAATTLLAALLEGRQAVGAEQDAGHYAIAQKRLARGYTPPLFTDSPEVHEQLRLDTEETG